MVYKIVCPYCDHEIKVLEYEEGYQALVCTECDQPFLNHTKMVPEFHPYAVVGCSYGRIYKTSVDVPTPEKIEQDIKPVPAGSSWRLCKDCLVESEPTLTSLDDMPWPVCPEYPNSLYRFDSEFVEVKYKTSAPVRTTWPDIHMLCEEDNPRKSIKELLGTDNTNKVAAMNAFVRAVKEGKVSE